MFVTSLPISVWLIWPLLHWSLSSQQHKIDKIAKFKKISGALLLASSAVLLSGLPFGYASGFELGFFYWLFAFMAQAILFLNLRIWHSKSVLIISIIFSLIFISDLIGRSYV